MDITVERIEQAIENNEFYLEYLPIICLETGICKGAEALIRWRVNGQQISPKQFIPLIENTQFSGIITYWVIEQLSTELLDWLKESDDVYFSFNVPPEIIGRGGIWHTIKKSGLEQVKDKLIAEITERGVPDQLAIKTLLDKDKYGFKVALDDVGTSPENLVLYSRLNIDMIKLDKSYADEMLEPEWTSERIQALKALALSATINIVAEGIETLKQSEMFKDAGIVLGQGWYYSKALRVDDFIKYHRSNC